MNKLTKTGFWRYLNLFPSPIVFTLIITLVFALSTSVAALIAVRLLGQEINERLFNDTQLLAETYQEIYKNAGIRALLEQIQLQTEYGTVGSTLESFWFGDGSKKMIGTLKPEKPFVGRKHLWIGKDIASVTLVDDESDGHFFGYGLKVNDGWILVAKDSRWITESQEVLELAILWGLGIAMFAVAIVAFWIAKMTDHRVHAINSVLTRAAHGDLNSRCTVETYQKDELASVSRGINQTLEQLQTSIQSLQQVSSDIAHDLRRPLTRLRLKIEQSTQRIDAPDKLEQELIAALADVDTLSSTFDSVLRLAQIESGAQTISREPVSLNELCREAFDIFEAVAEETNHKLQLIETDNLLQVTGDRNLLRQALINLVDNALRYTPAGSNIQIATGLEQQIPYIFICDNGPGIPEDEIHLVLRRFYRADKSRHIEGTGLGLSLVSAIISRHEAKLLLSNNLPGLCAKILF